MNGPFVLTRQSLASFIQQQQWLSAAYKTCAVGCLALGVALFAVKVSMLLPPLLLPQAHWEQW